MTPAAPASPPDAETVARLVEAARAARARAYAPYSRYAVGAALLDTEGRIHAGVNVENASYGLTQCAERSAVTRAVTEGARAFVAVAVVADSPEPPVPCGACRQVLAEFGDAWVITANLAGAVRTALLHELFPGPFRLLNSRTSAAEE